MLLGWLFSMLTQKSISRSKQTTTKNVQQMDLMKWVWIQGKYAVYTFLTTISLRGFQISYPNHRFVAQKWSWAGLWFVSIFLFVKLWKMLTKRVQTQRKSMIWSLSCTVRFGDSESGVKRSEFWSKFMFRASFSNSAKKTWPGKKWIWDEHLHTRVSLHLQARVLLHQHRATIRWGPSPDWDGPVSPNWCNRER